MLLTFIALRSLWRVWQERRQRILAHKCLHQSGETGVPGGPDAERDDSLPFWQTVLAYRRKEVSRSESRRARTRQALDRLSRISERRRTGHSLPGTDTRTYAPHQSEAGAN